MSSHTPKRLSLRRKRPKNETNKRDDPPEKRMSPSYENQKKEVSSLGVQSKISLKNQIQNQGASAVPPTTPKSSRSAKGRPLLTTSTPGEPESSVSALEGTSADASASDRCSPNGSYSPFASSQMPSTQVCEVFWDCNSPGYSKEDLKRIVDGRPGEQSSPKSPIAPSRPRRFSRARRPPLLFPVRLAAKDANAVVAQDLDNLLNKVNVESVRRQLDDRCSSEEETPQQHLNANILNLSSQPFDVSCLERNAATVEEGGDLFEGEAGGNCFDDLDPFGDESEDKPDEPHQGFKEGHVDKSQNSATSCSVGTNGKKRNQSLGIDKSESAVNSHCGNSAIGIMSNVNADNISFSSADDDLFNESFLKSTLALEDALFNKETGKFHSPAVTVRNEDKKCSPLSRIWRKKPTILFHQEHETTTSRSQVPADSAICLAESVVKKLNVRSDDQERKENSGLGGDGDAEGEKGDAVSPSPIIGKVRKSPVGRTDVLFHGGRECKSTGGISGGNIGSKPSLSSPIGGLKRTSDNTKSTSVKSNRTRASFQLGPTHDAVNNREDTFEVSDKSANKQRIQTQTPFLKSSSGNKSQALSSKTVSKWNLRTKSESSHPLASASKKKTNSCDLTLYENLSQELDDDDEIFASLTIPTLLQVEAEHANNLSQCVKHAADDGDQNFNHNSNNVPNTRSYSSNTSDKRVSSTKNSFATMKHNSLVPKLGNLSTKDANHFSFTTNTTQANFNGGFHNKTNHVLSNSNPSARIVVKGPWSPIGRNKKTPCPENANLLLTKDPSSVSTSENKRTKSLNSASTTTSEVKTSTKATPPRAVDTELGNSNSTNVSSSSQFGWSKRPDKAQAGTRNPPANRQHPKSVVGAGSEGLQGGEKTSSPHQQQQQFLEPTVNKGLPPDTKLGFDDDDIFFSDDVLEYVSLVETEYAASQCEQRKTSAPGGTKEDRRKTPSVQTTPNSGSSKLKNDANKSSFNESRILRSNASPSRPNNRTASTSNTQTSSRADVQNTTRSNTTINTGSRPSIPKASRSNIEATNKSNINAQTSSTRKAQIVSRSNKQQTQDPLTSASKSQTTKPGTKPQEKTSFKSEDEKHWQKMTFDNSFEDSFDNCNSFLKKELLNTCKVTTKFSNLFKNGSKLPSAAPSQRKDHLNDSISSEAFLSTAFEESFFDDSFGEASFPMAAAAGTTLPNDVNRSSTTLKFQASDTFREPKSNRTNDLSHVNSGRKRLGTSLQSANRHSSSSNTSTEKPRSNLSTATNNNLRSNSHLSSENKMK